MEEVVKELHKVKEEIIDGKKCLSCILNVLCFKKIVSVCSIDVSRASMRDALGSIYFVSDENQVPHLCLYLLMK